MYTCISLKMFIGTNDKSLSIKKRALQLNDLERTKWLFRTFVVGAYRRAEHKEAQIQQYD